MTDRVAVVGAGIAGLATALALGRSGRRVLLLERDAPGSVSDGPLGEVRRGVPQGCHTHGLLARLSVELGRRFPDVLADLKRSGAAELRLPGVAGDLTVVMARRATLEAALRRAVAAERTVEVRAGIAVNGLSAEQAVARGGAQRCPTSTAALRPFEGLPSALGASRSALGGLPSALEGSRSALGGLPSALEGSRSALGGLPSALGESRSALGGLPAATVPMVTGVTLVGGGTIEAETVVVAAGRRSDVGRWLSKVGVTIAEERRDHGLVYLTRWYRLAHAERPPIEPRVFGDTGFLKYLAVPADGGLMSVSLCLKADDELRPRLSASDRFDRAVRTLPDPAGFLATHLGEPVGPVHPMGGLGNRRRFFTDPTGEPLVLGCHAVGDAHTCTNPIHGRGCSVALVQAGLLADAFDAHPEDPVGRARWYEAATAGELDPWYRLSVMVDQPRRTMSVEMRQASTSLQALFGAVVGGMVDEPVLLDACSRVVNMLTTPEALFAESEVMARAAALLGDADRLAAVSAAAPVGPTRHQLLRAVA